jgi:hypothetical protein
MLSVRYLSALVVALANFDAANAQAITWAQCKMDFET